MSPPELEALFDERGLLQDAALIRYKSWCADTGVALRLCENLTETWQSGDIIVFWSNGDYTALPEEGFELVNFLFPATTSGA